MWFDLHFLSQSSLLQLGIHLDIQVKPWQILWQFYQKYVSLLVGLWQLLLKIGIFVSRPKLSRDSGFSSKIETIPPNSRRLDTRQGVFGESREMLPRKKITEIWNLQTAGNALKLSILPSPCYFCIIKKYFTISSGGPFWLLGGGGVACAPRAPLPPCLRACLAYTNSVTLVFQAIWLVRYLWLIDIVHLLGGG